MSRQTRSGHEFSPYTLAEPLVCPNVLVSALLQRQLAEMDGEGDSTDEEFGVEDDDDGDNSSDDGQADIPPNLFDPTSRPTLQDASSSASWIDHSPIPSMDISSHHPPGPSSVQTLAGNITTQLPTRKTKGYRHPKPKNSAKRSSHARRNRKRQDVQDALGINIKLVTLQRVRERSSPIPLPKYHLDCDAPVDSSAFTVRREPAPAARPWRLPDYVSRGYRHIRWLPQENRWVEGACVPIVDGERRFLVLLGGKPRDAEGRRSWKEVEDGIPVLIEAARRGVRFPKKMTLHRRGRFPAPSRGVGYGGGEKRPMNRSLTKSVQGFMDRMVSSPLVRRLSGWVNCLFAAHNPGMFSAYAENLDAILERDASLLRNFANSVFALLTVNVGPYTITDPHRDRANRPPGWCPVSAFGHFDATQGGQMVLDELKLIIDFPAGTTIFIPSAIVTHSNTGISPGETRYSITQYTPGALFRWAYNGFRTQEAFFHAEETTLEDKARFWRDQSTRWVDSLKYFPKLL